MATLMAGVILVGLRHRSGWEGDQVIRTRHHRVHERNARNILGVRRRILGLEGRCPPSSGAAARRFEEICSSTGPCGLSYPRWPVIVWPEVNRRIPSHSWR